MVGLLIVWRVAEDDVSLTIKRHAVVRVRQIFRREPKTHRVLRHEIKRPSRSDCWRTGRKRHAVEFGNEGEMPHRKFPILRTKVEIVHREGLLVERWIRAFGKRQHYGIDVAHVMAAHYIRTVGDTARMLFVCRTQKKCG